MFFIKKRKLVKHLEGRWNSNLIFEAMDINKLSYTLIAVGRKENLLEACRSSVDKLGWKSDKTMVSWVVEPKRRIALLVNDVTFTQWIKMVNKIVGLKAFL
jgi:hypothetical protein